MPYSGSTSSLASSFFSKGLPIFLGGLMLLVMLSQCYSLDIKMQDRKKVQQQQEQAYLDSPATAGLLLTLAAPCKIAGISFTNEQLDQMSVRAVVDAREHCTSLAKADSVKRQELEKLATIHFIVRELQGQSSPK
ncbi:MAG: hypothetical protein Q7S87_00860 [Agitococcus sp.]|nr:hypothetical protein [Agitococcus sp.]MDO9177151.1 hypothetical protein [Agitococcus sp.]